MSVATALATRKKISVATRHATKISQLQPRLQLAKNLNCKPTWNWKICLLQPHLQLGKNLSCNRTCNWKKSQLQPDLQLKYLSCNRTCNWKKISTVTWLKIEKLVSCNRTCNWGKNLSCIPTYNWKVSVAATLATIKISELHRHLQLEKKHKKTTQEMTAQHHKGLYG